MRRSISSALYISLIVKDFDPFEDCNASGRAPLVVSLSDPPNGWEKPHLIIPNYRLNVS